ncbi:heavy-metal-associated domain-containing protein [Clostridium butyricum]|uniref:heavy-metal-associated domain-containing protein n=1 Tax=Clostridium butyricum TaxID=1492 RepID=UPI0024BA8CCF|nr:cation transporter [Clostridium butyricum]
MEKKILIEGMSCNHCVSHVKEALSGIDGVLSVVVNLEGKYALVNANNVTDDQLRNTIEDEGYDVVEIK